MPRTINAITSTAHTLFALGADGTIWFSDDYTAGWTQILFKGGAGNPTGTPVSIAAARWPGPSGNIFLFVACNNQTLWRYDRDSGIFVSCPYLS
jgi:hypothetical protein